MDLPRLKRFIAGASMAAISLTQAGSVFAAYTDVPSGVWFEDAVGAFVDAGYLDASQSRFRGGDSANRAEFVKLVVELNGGILSTPPAVPSFDDVATGAWYYGYMEEAGKEGWVRGDGDCYGSHPCYARPGANINRAEAAAHITRSFGLEATGDAAQFVDNPSGQWYTDVIQTAADHCVLQGDDNSGRVRPGDNMNRAEMVVMLYRVDQGLTYGVDCAVAAGGEAMIVDAVATSSTSVEVEFNATLDAASAEDVGNYTVTGSPEVAVSSAALLNPQTVELTFGESLSAGHEYTLSVSGLLAADGSTIDDAITFTGYTAFVQGDGVLELSLSAATPVGDTVPQGAVGVVMLSVDLTSSCDDSVTVESMTVLHEGFGASTDINGVYAAINGARVTRKRTIDAEDQTADLRFASPLVLDPCETVTVDLVVDFTSSITAAAEHNIVVELPSDVFGNAKEVTGNFPVRGNTFRVAAVTSGTVSVTYRTVSPDEVEVGDKGIVIGKWEIAVDSTEDQTFYSMTIEQNSSASDGDFTNLAIRRTDGTILTNTVAQTVGDFITLVFDPPFTVLEGDKVTLEVISDVVGGAGDSIIMHFEESSDLFAVGSLYGYGVNGQLYGSQVSLPSETAALPDTVSIDAGEFTLGIDGPATQDYTRDDNDAVLANISLTTGGEDIDVKDLYIAIQAVSSTGGTLCGAGGATTAGGTCTTGTDDTIQEILEDVEIRNTTTGRTIDGVRLTGSTESGNGTAALAEAGTFQIYRFDDFIIRGEEVWEFRVDFIDNGAGNHPESGDQFRIHICGEPKEIRSGGANATNTSTCSFNSLVTAATTWQMDVEGLSTGDKVGDVRPRGNIAGNYQRIATATLTVAVKPNGVTDTAVENAKDVNLLRMEARAGEAEDILFTKAIFEAQSGSLNDGQNYALWVDTDGDGTVDTILEDGVASQSSQVTFGDMAGGGYVIPAEETVVFEVHADIASSLTGNDLMLRFATGTTVTFLEAEELDDGSNLSGIRLNTALFAGATTADIIVTTVYAQDWVLVSQGNLYITESTSTLGVRKHQLLGGELGETVLRMEFRAEFEDIDVTDIQLTASGTTTSNEVDRLELFKDGESEPFALATIGGCGNDDTLGINPGTANTAVKTFCANMESRQLVVPEGEEVDVLVRPRVKTDVEGSIPKQPIQFFVDNQNSSDEATGSGAIRARGDESSNNLAANNEDTSAGGEVFIGVSTATTNAYITGKKGYCVTAKVVSITNDSDDPNGSAIPIGLSDIGKFKFTAADHSNSKDGLNTVTLSGIIFNVNATNVTLDSSSGNWLLYNQNDSNTTVTCNAFKNDSNRIETTGNASGSLLVQCLDDANLVTDINPGKSITFVLQGNITNQNNSAVGAPSTLQVSLQNFDTDSRPLFGTQNSNAYSHIEWRDLDSASTVQEFTWIEYPTTVVKSTSYAG